MTTQQVPHMWCAWCGKPTKTLIAPYKNPRGRFPSRTAICPKCAESLKKRKKYIFSTRQEFLELLEKKREVQV